MSSNAPKYLRLADGRLGLRRFHDEERLGTTLLCFPYAGGQSLAFRALADQLPRDWAVWAIDPPGHGWAAPPALERVEDMVDLYLDLLPGELIHGSVLLGHSLGGSVAFAICQRLTARGAGPRGLILSGTRPPGRLAEYESFLAMDDHALLRTLIQIGGVPAEWADEPELFGLFKDTLRADFRAFEAFAIEQPLTGVPTLSVGGLEDDVCRSHHVFDWTRFSEDCRVDFVEGRHMFVQTHAAGLARRVVEFVANLPAR